MTTDEAIAQTLQQLGRDAVVAQRVLSTSGGEQRNRALHAIAASLRLHQSAILTANEHDVNAAKAAGLSSRQNLIRPPNGRPLRPYIS